MTSDVASGVAEDTFAPAADAVIAVPATTRDDRVLPLPRAVAILVIPFLLVAFGVLYVQPGLAADLFAWPIKPQLTAMLLGSAYLGGVVFFSFVLGTRRWHQVSLGFPPVAVFASLLMVTTLMHWGLFSFDRAAGVTWVLIYVVAPPLVVGAWWLNRRRDPGPTSGDRHLPRAVTTAVLVGGAAAMVFAALLYAFPETFVDAWPWRLTPLSARVLAPMICLPGILAIGIAGDRRLSAQRRPLIAQAAALVAMLLALVVRREDLVGPPVSVALAWIVLVGSLVATLALVLLPGGLARRMPAHEPDTPSRAAS